MSASKKELQKALREATFDPRKPSHLSVIVEDADADYVTERAMEILREIKVLRPGHEAEQCRVRDAISLLAYGQVLRARAARVIEILPEPALRVPLSPELLKKCKEKLGCTCITSDDADPDCLIHGG